LIFFFFSYFLFFFLFFFLKQVIFATMRNNGTDGPGPGWETFSTVIGWVYFLAWSVSFYPQVITNWRRKSVTGLSFDYVFYNLLGFTCYSLYNGFLFYSEEIREQYAERYNEESPKVSTNDVFFAFHAVALTIVNIIQIFLYERGRQKVSWLAVILISMAVLSSLIWTICIASGLSEWIELLYYLSYIKLSLTFIKYCPQVYLNWKRKSTVGWNIINILLDLTGGVLSILQQLLDCWIDDDWSGITGNFAKFGLGFISIFFDLIFISQHYYFYTDRSEPVYQDGVIKKVDGGHPKAYDSNEENEEVKGLVDQRESDRYNYNSVNSSHLTSFYSEVKSFVFWLTAQQKP